MTKMFKIALPDGSVKEMPEGSTPGRRRRGDRAGPGQGRACRQGRRRSARHHAPVRGRREPRADHLARREGRARARPPRLRAHPRRGGAEPLPGHPDHLRPGDRRRLLLRFRADAPEPRPVHRRGPAGDRGGDAAHHRRRQAAGPRSLGSRAQSAQFFDRPWRGVQGRVGDGAARGRADHHVQDGSRRGRLDRPVPRAAPRLDRQARPAGVQADARFGRLLARRPQEPDAEPHLRHGVAQQEAARRLSRPARGSGQARPSQDRAGDGPVPPPGRGARQRLLAPERLRHLARSSRPICAAGSTRPATRRSRPRS